MKGTVFLFVLAATLLPLDFGFRQKDRALRGLATALRLKTGWLVSVEEPVWPATTKRSAYSIRSRSPEADQLYVPGVAIRGRDKSDVVREIALLYSQQNLTRTATAIEAGRWSVLVESCEGATTPLLSQRVHVPRARRMPQEHLNALAKALFAVSGTYTTIGTSGLGPIAEAWLGSRLSPRDLTGFPDHEHYLTEWGTDGSTAREALTELLDQSSTTFAWQLNCEPGIKPFHTECMLWLDPLTIDVRNAAGRVVQETLWFDRDPAALRRLPPPPLAAQ